MFINTASSAQIQQLFFGDQKQGSLTNGNSTKIFQITKEIEEFEQETAKLLESNPYINHNAAMLKSVLKEKGKNFIHGFTFLLFLLFSAFFSLDFLFLFFRILISVLFFFYVFFRYENYWNES